MTEWPEGEVYANGITIHYYRSDGSNKPSILLKLPRKRHRSGGTVRWCLSVVLVTISTAIAMMKR